MTCALSPNESLMIAHDDLPEGWALATLPDIASIQMGQSPPGSTYNTRKDGLPFFQGCAEFNELYPIAVKWCTEPTRIVEKNAVLLSVRAPVGPTNLAPFQCAIGRGLAGITPKDGIPSRFLLHFVRTVAQELAEQGSGSTFEAVTKDQVFGLQVSVPPLAEQERIVEAIERLTARVDAARERVAKLPTILKRFRQAVLAAACSGDLTTDWREKSPAREGPAPVPDLVQAHHQLAWNIRQTLRRAKLAKPITLVPLDLTAPEELRELPATWSWIPLGVLGADPFNTVQTGPFGAQLHKDEFVPQGIPVIAVGNLTGMSFTTENLYYITPAKAAVLHRYDVNAGDVLFARSGATLGKVCVAPDSVKDWRMTGHILRARFERSLILPEMAVYALWGDLVVKDQVSGNIRGVTRPGFNTSLLESVWLPVPTIAEQAEIIRRVQGLMKLADAIEQRVALASARADKVTQAILAKAFRGELVPTEADLARAEGRTYESAVELIARIANTNNGNSNSRRQRRATR